MPYTDIADLRSALSLEGEQDAQTPAVLSDAQLTDKIAEAQAVVDTRLRGLYSVPFADDAVPPMAKMLTRDLAAYEAWLVFRKGQSLDERHPAALRFARATALLDAIQAGTVTIEAIEGAAIAVENRYDGDLFTLEGFGLATSDGGPARLGWPYPP